MAFPTPTPLPKKALIGMVHVRATPGSPAYSGESVDRIVETAVGEARTLARLGFDSVIIENMHDRPYIHGGALGPEVVAVMTRVGQAVAAAVSIPLGIQILSGGNRQALAVAHAVGASYIRCENFVFAHVADEGLLARAEAGELLRYRKSIGAEKVAVFCDVKKKHASHALTADLSLADVVHGAEFFGADGVIVTGTATGRPVAGADLEEARGATRLPVLVGSGVTPESAGDLLAHADALIVGSAIKRDGVWSEPLDEARCARMVESVRAVRGA